jgi:AGZA family xanthine/uracil permease-like MFS transporter
MIGGGIVTDTGTHLYPVIAPALVVVGSFMARNIKDVSWNDPTEAIPAFLTILLMPLTVSITDGITFGLGAYSLLKLATGRHVEAHWIVHVMAGLLVLRYIML